MLDRNNPTQPSPIQGQVFDLEFELDVLKIMLLSVMGGILGIQLLLGLASIACCRTILCRDGGYIGTARLLRDLTLKLGPHGTAASDQDIWDYYNDKVRVRYAMSNGEDELVIGEEEYLSRKAVMRADDQDRPYL